MLITPRRRFSRVFFWTRTKVINRVMNRRRFEMNKPNVISFWGLLKRFFGTVLVVVLILPLLMVTELVYAPEWVSNWLWDLGGKLIGGIVD